MPHQFKYHLWWYSSFYIHALLYRSGKCREEKTWGKTENGPEKPHQINRGMENKVSHWGTWCNAIVPLLIVLIITRLLSCPTNYVVPFIVLEKECCTWSKVWFKSLLCSCCFLWCEVLHYTTLLRTKCTTAAVCVIECICQDTPEDAGVWYYLVWTRKASVVCVCFDLSVVVLSLCYVVILNKSSRC